MPSGPPQFPEELFKKTEAWLRYYQDIGIRSFYRDRLPGLNRRMVTPNIVMPNIVKPNTVAQNTGTAPASLHVTLPAAEMAAKKVTTAKAAQVVKPEPLISVSQAVPRLQDIAQDPPLFEGAARVLGDTLERISADLGDCTRCKLHRGRNKIVFGAGNPNADLVFVGEGPGHDEDIQGLPFVGRAGKLLTQMIEAMGLRRDQVYIANVVKCRPPENRAPEKDEVAECMPFLFRQLAAINPKAIVSLGNVATQALLGTTKGISQFRGQWFDFRGSKLMVTYHPAYLLRNPPAKADVWVDLKKVMVLLGLEIPKPGPRASQP